MMWKKWWWKYLVLYLLAGLWFSPLLINGWKITKVDESILWMSFLLGVFLILPALGLLSVVFIFFDLQRKKPALGYAFIFLVGGALLGYGAYFILLPPDSYPLIGIGAVVGLLGFIIINNLRKGSWGQLEKEEEESASFS